MAYWFIMAGAVLLLPILGLWPIRVTGVANQNTAWFIRMKPREQQTQPYAAIFAQEVVEFWLKWLVGAVASIPVAIVTRDEPNGWAFQALAIMAGTLLARPFAKQLELIGHAVEVDYARRFEGVGEDYIGREARSMIRGYPQFRDMAEAEVVAAMEARMGLARVLRRLLWLRIRREAR